MQSSGMFIFFKRSLLPLKCVKLKLFLFLIIVLQSNVAFGQSKKTETNDLLLPFKKGKVWGLSKLDKQIIVKPQYVFIHYSHPYYFAEHKSQDRIDVYDVSGNKLDTCQFYTTYDGLNYFLFKRSSLKFEGDVEIVQSDRLDLANQSRMAELDTNYTVSNLKNKQSERLTDGIIRFFSFSAKNDFVSSQSVYKGVISVDGKLGVFDFIKNKYIVDPDFKNIKFIPPFSIVAFNDSSNLLVTDISGKQMNQNPNYIDACYIDTETGKYVVRKTIGSSDSTSKRPVRSNSYYYEYRNKENSTLFPYNNNWQFDTDHTPPDYFKTWGRGNGMHMSVSLFDLDGNKIIDSIQNLNGEICNHVYEIRNFGSGKHNLIGLYNTQLKKYIWENNDTSKRINIIKSNHLPQIEIDSKPFFFDDKGINLINIINKKEPFNAQLKFCIKNEVYDSSALDMGFSGRTRKYLYALSETRENPCKVFDDNFNYHPEIQSMVSIPPSITIACKVNHKWGIYDSKLNELIPPVYDNVTIEGNQYILKKDSVNHYFENQGARKIKSTKYANVSKYQANGLWMVILKQKNDNNIGAEKGADSINFLFVDSLDQIQYRITRALNINRNYRMTANGNLLEYSPQKGVPVILIDIKTMTEKILPYQFHHIIENEYSPLVTVVCEKEGKLGLVSALNFELIDNFDKNNLSYSTYYEVFKGNSGAITPGVYIEKTGPVISYEAAIAEGIDSSPTNEKTIIGIVTYDGKKYWIP